MEPFYDENDIQITVSDVHTLELRLDDIEGERDTSFIALPGRFAVESTELFRFYVVENYSDRNEFGIWVYSYAPKFNFRIKGCTFSIIKGRNSIKLPPTVVTDSYVGIYKSPCFDIVNNEAILCIYVHLPNMTFETNNMYWHHVQRKCEQKTIAIPGNVFKKLKKLKEVRLDDEISTSYKNMMKEGSYDVYFVIDGKKIGTFKFALCAVSDVFKAAFKEHTKESQTGEIVIDDTEYEIVKIFVDALHTFKIYFDEDPIKTLKIKMMANKYNVAAIEKAAINAVNVSKNNFVSIYRFASYDEDVIELLTKRFVDMKIDITELLDFDQIDHAMQIRLLRSAHLELIKN